MTSTPPPDSTDPHDTPAPAARYAPPPQGFSEQYAPASQTQQGQAQYPAQPLYPAQPQYPYPPAAPAQPQGKSIASFVLGLCSLVFGFFLVVPIVGFILGLIGLRKEPTAKGFAITGIVLNGFIGFVWVLLFVVAIIGAILGW